MQALCLPLASLICASPRCFFTLSTASLTEIGDVNFPILPIPYPDLGIYKHTGIRFYMHHKHVIFSFIEWYSWIFKIACKEWLVFYNLRNSEFSLFHQNLKFMKILYLNIYIHMNFKMKLSHMCTFKNMITIRSSKTSLLHIQWDIEI